MEPARAFERARPVHFARLDLGDGRVGAVVGDLGGALAGAGFEKVNADAVARADDVPGADAQAAQFVDGALAHVVLGQASDKFSVQAVVGQGNGDIGLAAAEGEFEGVGLTEPEEARRGQAHHDFTESYNIRHNGRRF